MRRLALSIIVAILVVIGFPNVGDRAAQAALIPVSLAVEPDILGEGWEQVVSGGFFPTYSLQPTVDHFVSVGLSDGTTDIFDVGLNPSSKVLFPFGLIDLVTVTLTPRSGALGTLEFVGDTSVAVLGGNTGPVELIDDIFLIDPFDPQEYRYTLDGQEFLLSKGFSLVAVSEPPTLGLFALGLALLGFALRRRVEAPASAA